MYICTYIYIYIYIYFQARHAERLALLQPRALLPEEPRGALFDGGPREGPLPGRTTNKTRKPLNNKNRNDSNTDNQQPMWFRLNKRT